MAKGECQAPASDRRKEEGRKALGERQEEDRVRPGIGWEEDRQWIPGWPEQVLGRGPLRFLSLLLLLPLEAAYLVDDPPPFRRLVVVDHRPLIVLSPDVVDPPPFRRLVVVDHRPLITPFFESNPHADSGSDLHLVRAVLGPHFGKNPQERTAKHRRGNVDKVSRSVGGPAGGPGGPWRPVAAPAALAARLADLTALAARLGPSGGPGGPLGGLWRPWQPGWQPVAVLAARLAARWRPWRPAGGPGGPQLPAAASCD
eukprot:gene7118-biopygen8390